MDSGQRHRLSAAAPWWRRLNLRSDLVISSPRPRALASRLAWVSLAVAAGLVACQPESAPEALPSSAPTEAPALAAATGCTALDLLDPSGNRVELTGTWREPSGGPVYYLWQDGDCVWYAGGFAASDGEQVWGPLGLFTLVFEGQARSDFTVVGRWAIVRMAGNSFGGYGWQNKTWTIEFEPSDGAYAVVLTSPPDTNGIVSATRLVQVSDAVVEP